jgi:hypothetical protein
VGALDELRALAAAGRATARGATHSDVDELARLVGRLREALVACPADPESHEKKAVWAIDPLILRVLKEASHRMTGEQILMALRERDPNTSKRTVWERLTAMRKAGILDNDQSADPKGYGLAAWKNRPKA